LFFGLDVKIKKNKIMELRFKKLFQSIDQSDTETFLTFLDENGIFKFGNLPAVEGKDSIREFLNQFFTSIDHTDHKNIEEFQSGNNWFTTGEVEYTRKDGSKLKVPFCNKFEMNGGDKIKKYEIFVDNSELYK
jgi:ketosteroid isomerase-like protein